MKDFDVIILGGGYAGLAGAYEMAKSGVRVAVVEKQESPGGLASGYQPEKGQSFEKFYHHWFCNDRDVLALVDELGMKDQLDYFSSLTGLFCDGKFYRLCSPMDLLRFKPLRLIDRIRLGLLVPQSCLIRNWKPLESITARQWLIKKCGRKVFDTLWEPLLRGKFGPYADDVSGVWFWNKIRLRGTSRDKSGNEILIYPRGGFQAFTDRIAEKITELGGSIICSATVDELLCNGEKVVAVKTSQGTLGGSFFLSTLPLPVTADLLEPHCEAAYISQLREIKHLANLCLVLELKEKLSDMYWLNICDPEFPFVGIIEHTNMVSPQLYNGRHLIYLSCYLDANEAFYQLDKEGVLENSIGHIKRIFPHFDESLILESHLFKSRFAQPIAGLNHSQKIPSWQSRLPNFFLETMAQVYPEDRGTNYAVRQGRESGRKLVEIVRNSNID